MFRIVCDQWTKATLLGRANNVPRHCPSYPQTLGVTCPGVLLCIYHGKQQHPPKKIGETQMVLLIWTENQKHLKINQMKMERRFSS